MDPRYAIVTIVMLNNYYTPGAIALGKSLRKYPPTVPGSKIETVCLITEGVDPEALKPYWDKVQVVPLITTTYVPGLGANAEKLYPWMAHAPTKWQILGLTQYDKVLFVDADMIVVADIGPLFRLEPPAAIFDHPSATYYISNPLWTGNRSKGGGFINWYYQSESIPVPTGMKIPRSLIERLSHNSNSQFAPQGSLVLLKPDANHLKAYAHYITDILKSLQMPVYRGKAIAGYRQTTSTLSGVDETSIAVFMHDQGKTWTNIGMDYGVTVSSTYDILKNQAKILHFNGLYKPWRIRADGLMEHEYVAQLASEGENVYKGQNEAATLWWSIYCS